MSKSKNTPIYCALVLHINLRGQHFNCVCVFLSEGKPTIVIFNLQCQQIEPLVPLKMQINVTFLLGIYSDVTS